MKNILYLLLLVLSTTVLGQNNFDKANKLYQEAKYQEALDAYQLLINDNQHSAELYYNMGNCAFKLHQVAPTIYYYEKALVLNPNDLEVRNNLKFAQKKTIDEIKVIPKVGFERILRDFTASYHYNTWAWITVGFGVLFLIAFWGYYFSSLTVSKRVFFAVMFLFLVGLFISLGAGFFEKNHYQNDKPAVVFAEKAEVHPEPKIGSPNVVVLHEGGKVYVLEKLKNWKKIQLTDGTEGWIDQSAIKEVK